MGRRNFSDSAISGTTGMLSEQIPSPRSPQLCYLIDPIPNEGLLRVLRGTLNSST